MTPLTFKFRMGRFIWTGLVTFYFIVFFRNFIADALAGQGALAFVFSLAFVLWLAVEYYFGSPFFQSGVVEPSALWRGVFAFFVYPYVAYVAADFIWWHWTQIPVAPVVTGVLGLIIFAVGSYARLNTLFSLLRLTRPAAGTKTGPAEPAKLNREGFIRLRFQQMARHPRYFATFLQLVGVAFVFRSWGGLVLALVVGLPLILVQARGEDARLRGLLGTEHAGYFDSVPLFWPRLKA